MRITTWKKIVVRLLLGLASLTFLLYLTVWIFSPMVARKAFNEFLAAENLIITSDSQIRYNPFLSNIIVRNLTLKKDEDTTLSLKRGEFEIDLYRLLGKTLYLKTFSIDNLTLSASFDNEGISIAGYSIARSSEIKNDTKKEESADQNNDSSSLADYQIIAPKIEIKSSQFDLKILEKKIPISLEDFSLEDIAATTKEQQAVIELYLRALGGNIKVSSDLMSNDNKITSTIKLTIDKVDLAQLGGFISDPINLRSALLSIDTSPTIEISEKGILMNDGESSIKLEKVNIFADGNNLTLEDLSTNFYESVVSIKEGSPPEFSTELAVVADGLNLENKGDTLAALNKFTMARSTLNGTTDVSGTSFATSIVSLEGLTVSQKRSDEPNGIPALARLEKIDISDISFRNATLDINKIQLSQLVSHIMVNPDKSIETLVTVTEKNGEALPSDSTDPTQTTPSTSSTSDNDDNIDSTEVDSNSQFSFNIKEIAVDKGSHLYFKDLSVVPNYERDLQINELVVTNLSNDRTTTTNFLVDAHSNEHTTIALDGEIILFAEHINSNINGKLREFSLHSVSPYIEGNLGFGFKSGQFDSDIDVTIVNSELDGEIGINMRGIEMTRSKDLDTSTLEENIAVPLNVALGMLKDREDNIELDVPVEGNVEDPSFGLNSVFMIVAKKAVMAQAKSYLINTFVPYANVVSIAMIAGKQALKLRFEDLAFSSGQVEIEEIYKPYISDFIKLMQDKDKAQVKICGIASLRDIDEDSIPKEQKVNTLYSIATQRANNFKRYVVENSNIESSRLLICAPEIDDGEEASGRIEIRM